MNAHRTTEAPPKGWCLTTLAVVSDLTSGTGFPIKYQGMQGLPYPFFKVGTLGEVDSGEFLLTAKDTVDEQTARCLKAKIIPANSIIFAKIGMAIRLNRRRVVGVDCCIDNNLMAAIPSCAIVGQYLLRFLETVDFMQLASATTVPSIRKSELASVSVPLPPLAEQRRIVAKVESLLARVQATRDRLARVPRLLRRFRQAVLTAACNGQLTEAWRDRPEGMDKSWKKVSADVACEMVQSGTTPRNNAFLTEPGIPFLKVYNIVDQRVDFQYRPQFVSDDAFRTTLRRSRVLPDDVLMNIVGPPLGKVAIVPNDYPEWAINQAIAAFRAGSELIMKYLYYLLRSGLPYEQVLMETRGSAGQSNISLTQCREMILPIPPHLEQREIVGRVDALFKLADAIERRVAAATKRADKLTQAILAKAFRGELIPTEAELARQEHRDYEPADQLLVRINAANTAKLVPKKRNSRSKPTRIP